MLMEAHMPTLGDHFAAYFTRPEVAEQLKPWGELFVEFQKMNVAMVQMAMAIAQRAEENHPSSAYGPYFEDRGINPVCARGLGSLAISIGTRRANEDRRLGPVVKAMRFLSQGNRQRRAILLRAKVLLAAWSETSLVDEIFRKSGLSAAEFLSLLKAVVEGGALERERIREIAAAVVPSLPSARGRKVSPASAAHEEFLNSVGSLFGPHGYTWSPKTEDYIDRETAATRREFGDPDFDPRAAYQRFEGRRKAKTSDGA
jgi:hypothetical protein